MSGGVDSSVTAALLAHQSHFTLEAIFMRNWDTADEYGQPSSTHGCEWEKDWVDVQRVCARLGLKARMVDLSKEYWTRVFEPAVREWERGRTPNPDVWCNKEIKFGALMDTLRLRPGEWLATGMSCAFVHGIRPLIYVYRPLRAERLPSHRGRSNTPPSPAAPVIQRPDILPLINPPLLARPHPLPTR